MADQLEPDPTPLELEFWPTTQTVDLNDLMGGPLAPGDGWLAEMGVGDEAGLPPAPAAAAAAGGAPPPLAPAGLSHAAAGSSSQLQQQQLLHSQLQAMHAMMPVPGGTPDAVSEGRRSAPSGGGGDGRAWVTRRCLRAAGLGLSAPPPQPPLPSHLSCR